MFIKISTPIQIGLLILLLISSGFAFLYYSIRSFENKFLEDVEYNINTNSIFPTENDVQRLPSIVQKYLRITNFLDQPKPYNLKIKFQGRIRGKNSNKNFLNFNSVQYNFFANPTRLFFMKSQMLTLPLLGYHKYGPGEATMNITLFGLWPVVKFSGSDLIKTETVTYFNDLCLFAPHALIDSRITWSIIDDLTVRATFTNNSIVVSAILVFDNLGYLRNFISEDRIEINEGKKLRFSTPVLSYTSIRGFKLPHHAQAIWHYPEGEFIYGEFNLEDLEYNLDKASF